MAESIQVSQAVPEPDEENPEEAAVAEENEGDAGESGASRAKRKKKAVPCRDLKQMFEAGDMRQADDHDAKEDFVLGPGIPLPSPARAPSSQQANVMVSAFKLKMGSVQQVCEEGMAPPLPSQSLQDEETQIVEDDVESKRLEQLVLTAPIGLRDLLDPVPLLEATVPLLDSGLKVFASLPPAWLDITGNSTAMGTRCLFASRRHENSVFKRIRPELLLQVPPAAREWQLPLDLPSDAVKPVEDEPWLLQIHPRKQTLRVLLRPGVLLLQMVRRGTALPAARFTWRIIDSHTKEKEERPADDRACAHPVGEFSILSNLEDAACTQPPNFLQHPLRREQLRSLGWMLMQERRSAEDPFVTELREAVRCPDAPHWKLEGCLRCEYRDVKGGVLADAIGYGKTACTIGLIDKTKESPLPSVPTAFRGFIPSRATLVLVPTNLHKQWLSEITKFTGDALKVISVPTCAQLKRLTVKELSEADVVVSTYRLFYSAPYLRRLEELARESSFGFAFPKHKAGAHEREEWSQAYRSAFEALPGWAAKLGIDTEPTTPARRPVAAAENSELKGESKRRRGKVAKAMEVKEETQAEEVQGKRRRNKGAKAPEVKEETQATQATQDFQGSQKRRRINGKQADATQNFMEPEPMRTLDWPLPALQTQYVPLEAFWWKRVVCDEFHELLSRYPPAQVAVELFHAEYKWGLSGTPPCQTLAQIRKAAGFLGVQLPTTLASDADKEEPRKVAQDWLDAFVRRNTAELPPFEEEERIVPVRQTVKERALYLALTEQQQLSQELGLSDTQTQALPQEIKALREVGRTTSGLLKLCSHFCFSGASDVLTAEDECQKQLALRRERIRRTEREVKSQAERTASMAQLIRHFEPLFAKQPDEQTCPHICKEAKAALTARLKFLGKKAQGSKAELQSLLFETAAQCSSAVRSRALAAGFEAKTAGKMSHYQDTEAGGNAEAEWKKILAELAPQEPDADSGTLDVAARAVQGVLREAISALPRDPAPRCLKTRKHLGMPAWPSSGEEHELATADWKWRNIKENSEKLQKIMNEWKADLLRSSQRLQALQAELADKMRSLTSFQDTLHASQAAAMEEPEIEGSKFAKYGSKIETLVKHAQKIQKEDPAAKMICFVQWEDLKRKISSALEEFGVPHIVLQGSVWGRQAALRTFQYEDRGPRMLLLSLEESASGTNLTAANHVLIVHPMEAHSQEEAVAFEMQAVGRVRRPGQEKKIHIWRFVTLDTIEQNITEEHQKELWERQAVRIEVSQTQAPQEVESDVDGDDFEAEPASMKGFDDAGSRSQMEDCTQRYVPSDVQMSKGIEEDDEVVINNKRPLMDDDVEMGGSVDIEATQPYIP